jgi:hypothetical protein
MASACCRDSIARPRFSSHRDASCGEKFAEQRRGGGYAKTPGLRMNGRVH